MEVGQRAVHPVVKLFVAGENVRFLSTPAFERTSCLLNDAVVVRVNVAMRIAIHFAGDRPLIGGISSRLQMDIKGTCRFAQTIRCRVKSNSRSSKALVQPVVPEHERAIHDFRL